MATLEVRDSKWREGYADGGSSRLEVLNLELIKVRGGYFFLTSRGLGALGFEIINGLEGLDTNYGFIAPTLGYIELCGGSVQKEESRVWGQF